MRWSISADVIGSRPDDGSSRNSSDGSSASARALALEPSLLVLDEPSSGLDPITSREIDHLIHTLARVLGLTVVIVTHELSSINAIVDRCILLDRDTRRILAAGTPRELAASPVPRVRHFFERVPEAA